MKKIMHILFLSCLKATELIEKKFHVKLNLKEKIQLSMHKSMCKACRLYEDHSKFLDTVLKEHTIKYQDIGIEELKASIKRSLLK